jgi:glycerol-3-phosphate dehydrogenase
MRRDLTRLCAEPHDVIVVGGGIYGACAAWEAARRSLKVALIEAGDFNQATSGNSLRTLHGGLRHLQRLDFVHMRESIRERREWLRLAPDLTQPLRFVLPLSGRGIHRPGVLRAALWVNDLLSADRNRAVRSDHQLPRSAVLTKSEFESRYPGLSLPDYNAAAAWYDGVCLNTERLQLAVVAAAVGCGAQAANYVRALQPLRVGSGISGTRVRDELTGRELNLYARLVINAAGPWIEEWLGCEPPRPIPVFRASKAFNLLVRKFPFRDALGLAVPTREQNNGSANTYFIMPWNDYSLVGTRHLRCDHAVRSAAVSRDDVLEFLADLNPLLGEHRLTGADVCGVFSGLLPEIAGAQTRDVALQRAPQIIEHTGKGRGLLSIVGVKWTTARAVGERAAKLACRRLGKSEPPARERALASVSAVPLFDADPALAARVVPDLPVVFGQIVHAARHEMAMRLRDVVRRRTPLYLSRVLDRSVLAACAAVMARELRWNRRETAAEIDAAEAEIAAFRGPLRADPRPAAA